MSPRNLLVSSILILFATIDLCGQSRLHTLSASEILSPYYQHLFSSTVYHRVEANESSWSIARNIDFCYINDDLEEGFYLNKKSSIVHYFRRDKIAQGYSQPDDYQWRHFTIDDTTRELLSDLFTLAVETSSPQSINDWIDASHSIFFNGTDIAEGWSTDDRIETKELIRTCDLALCVFRTDSPQLLKELHDRFSVLSKYYRSLLGRDIWHDRNYVGIGSDSSYLYVLFETKQRIVDHRSYDTKINIENSVLERVLKEFTNYLLEQTTGPLYFIVLIVPNNMTIEQKDEELYDLCVKESEFNTETLINLYECNRYDKSIP